VGGDSSIFAWGKINGQNDIFYDAPESPVKTRPISFCFGPGGRGSSHQGKIYDGEGDTADYPLRRGINRREVEGDTDGSLKGS